MLNVIDGSLESQIVLSLAILSDKTTEGTVKMGKNRAGKNNMRLCTSRNCPFSNKSSDLKKNLKSSDLKKNLKKIKRKNENSKSNCCR